MPDEKTEYQNKLSENLKQLFEDAVPVARQLNDMSNPVYLAAMQGNSLCHLLAKCERKKETLKLIDAAAKIIRPFLHDVEISERNTVGNKAYEEYQERFTKLLRMGRPNNRDTIEQHYASTICCQNTMFSRVIASNQSAWKNHDMVFLKTIAQNCPENLQEAVQVIQKLSPNMPVSRDAVYGFTIYQKLKQQEPELIYQIMKNKEHGVIR